MLTLNTEQKAIVTVKPLTIKGNPAPVDGPPGWTIANPAVASLVVAPDGLSAEVLGGTVGTTMIIVSADADMTGGVREISGSLGVTVVAAEAFALTLEPGTPTVQ